MTSNINSTYVTFSYVERADEAGKQRTDSEQVSNVEKNWKPVSADSIQWQSTLKEKFPYLNILDAPAWKSADEGLGLSFEGKNQVEVQKLENEVSLFVSDLKKANYPVEESGITYLTFPKDFSLNTLWKLGQSGQGHHTGCAHMPYLIGAEFGDVKTTESSSVLMTNALLPQSTNLSNEEQSTLLAQYHLEKPSLLAVSTLMVLTYYTSEIRLFPHHQGSEFMNYTRVVEEQDGFPLMVGCFSETKNGIYINNTDEVDDSIGVAAMRRVA